MADLSLKKTLTGGLALDATTGSWYLESGGFLGSGTVVSPVATTFSASGGAALFGAKKSDPVEARAAAHYALRNPSTPVRMLPAEMRSLRQVASRLQAVVRQRTRLINQLHLLLALTFPELALLVPLTIG